MAPIVMLQHSWYVVSILMGMTTGWNAQTRTDRALPFKLTAHKFAAHMLVGVAATFVLWRYANESFNWFVPLLAGLWLAIPLVFVSSSPLLGLATRKDGLFLVPSETRGLKVLRHAHALAGNQEEPLDEAQQLVLDDARVRDLHLALLAGAPVPFCDPARLRQLRAQAVRRETTGFSRDDWNLLLSDSEGLKALA
jgi:membrane glycosyltransferase